ncbi:MAG: ATPase, T2SS/T4P/T4SS family [Clostridia bacterium]
MIVNPFKTADEEKVNITNEEVDIKLLQKYLIDNYLTLLQNENRELLKINIQKYLYEKYGLNDEFKINEIIIAIFNKMFGYDILEQFIQDEKVSDIRAVRYNQIYIKKSGKWIKTDVTFNNEKEFYDYIRYTVLKNNGNINFDTPIIVISDKKYNLRIEAGIQPVNVLSPSIVIRIHRHSKDNNLESLFIKDDMINASLYTFLNKVIDERKNIILSGKGGSGKTTLLRALIEKLPDELAICTNEETTELFIENKNIIQREILENREDDKKITLEKLTKHSLINSNDVIIIRRIKRSRKFTIF